MNFLQLTFYAIYSGYEEESPPPENYYARDYREDEYSPSPPHASGGSYYPENNQFPPPPQPQPENFYTHETRTTSTTHIEETSPGAIPPYNPANYAGQPPNRGPYRDAGGRDNVSGVPDDNDENFHVTPPTPNPITTTPLAMPNPANFSPYFPPPPTAPVVAADDDHDPPEYQERELNDEGAPFFFPYFLLIPDLLSISFFLSLS